MLYRRKEKEETTKKKTKTPKWMADLGIDADKIKKEVKVDALNLMLFANFKLDRLRYS